MRKLWIAFAGLLLAACASEIAPAIDGVTTEIAPTATETPLPTETPTPTITPSPQPERHTSVLMGTDWDSAYPERVQFGERTDVLVLVTWVETWEGELTDFALISLPRDLWVKVPCSPLDPALEGYDRTNAAYAYGGFPCVRQMVEQNFGLEVDQPMFLVQMRPFMEVIKLFEPLKVTPKETYRDWCGDFLGTDGRGGYKLWTATVEYTMDPNQLMCYLRGRNGAASGDLDRNRRALEVLAAMARQYPEQVSGDLANWGPGQYIALWGIFAEHIQSDLQITDFPDLVHLVPQALSSIDGSNGGPGWKIVRMTLEETDFYRTPIYSASVLLPTVELRGWMDCMVTGSAAAGWDVLRQSCTAQFTLPLVVPMADPTMEPSATPQAHKPDSNPPALMATYNSMVNEGWEQDVAYSYVWCEYVRARPFDACLRMTYQALKEDQ